VLINDTVIHTYTCYLSNPNYGKSSDKDAVYLIKSVVGDLHICKKVRSPTVCEGLQHTCEDRYDDCYYFKAVLLFMPSS